jgi:isochorismate synthase
MQKIRDKIFVWFRFPGENEVRELVQIREGIFESSDFKENGFYLAPFLYPSQKALFIPMEFSDYRVFSFSGPKETAPGPVVFLPPDADEHKRKVAQAVQRIRSEKDLDKLVISSVAYIETEKFEPAMLFETLSRRYPDSFVFLFHHPQAEVIMAGASPEPLLFYETGEKGGTGKTVSLAGTKFADKPRPWTEKEIHEQKLVTDYIKDVLQEKAWAFSVTGPYDYKQGDLIHLRTDFEFIFPFIPDFPACILKTLHPTPAVAGLPKKKAVNYLRDIEGYDRAFYTGFAGFKNDGTGKFFVNLRSMRRIGGRWLLYAGGGITAGSSPGAEWEEVMRKWRIMAGVFSE